jgi:hypothetical protein
MRIFIVSIFTIFLLLSCKKEESIIESELPTQTLFVVTEDNPNSLQTLEIPSLKLNSDDAYYLTNGKKLNEINQIVIYRNLMFIFQSKSFKITICTYDSLRFVSELDWSSDSRIPLSIAFPNATTGFISFANDTTLEVLDLSNFQIARRIKTPAPVIHLECIDYYVIGISLKPSKLFVFDSRTYSLVKQVDMPDYPIDISIHPLKESIFVLCLGKGRVDSTEAKTPAKLAVISYPNFDVSLTKEIGISNVSALDLLTNGIEVAGQYFGFISSDNGLIRFSVTNPDQMQKYIAGAFFGLSYNFKIDQIMAVEKKSPSMFILYLLNPVNASIQGKYVLNFPVRLLLPR